jgi:hypothetical protein
MADFICEICGGDHDADICPELRKPTEPPPKTPEEIKWFMSQVIKNLRRRKSQDE